LVAQARDYLGWCGSIHKQGDCLQSLRNGGILDAHGRYVVAMAIPQGSTIEATKASLKGMVNPDAVAESSVALEAVESVTIPAHHLGPARHLAHAIWAGAGAVRGTWKGCTSRARRPHPSAVRPVLLERGSSGLEGRVGRVEAGALRVLPQVPERPCYIATRSGPQAAINSAGIAGALSASSRNFDRSVRRRPGTALNGPLQARFESGEGQWDLAVTVAWRL
jgi:hypothetical protein